MQTRTFCILLITAFSTMLGLGIISPFLPEFAQEHGANGFWIGMMFAGFGISRGIVMPIVGRMSDRTGRKLFVAAGLFLFTIISLLYPKADSVYAIIAVRMAHGFAAGLIMPVVMAYVGEFAKEGNVGLATGPLNMMFYFGLAMGPFLGGYIGQNYGFDAVFHVMSILGGLTFLIVVFFLPEYKPSSAKPAESLMSFSALIKYNFVKAVLIAAVVVTLMMAVFMSFLPSLATHIKMDPDHVGIIISTGIFLAGLLQIPFGRFADRLDHLGKLFQVGIGTCIGMFALFIMPFCPDFSALLGAGSLLGIGAAISSSALLNISVNIGQTAGMGVWMGTLNAAMSIGFVLTPILSGIIMDHLGINSVFYLFGLLMLFGALGSAHFIRRRLFGFIT
ncbi:MAG: MFS transporter [Candidatus Omnitrophota bacterium]